MLFVAPCEFEKLHSTEAMANTVGVQGDTTQLGSPDLLWPSLSGLVVGILIAAAAARLWYRWFGWFDPYDHW